MDGSSQVAAKGTAETPAPLPAPVSDWSGFSSKPKNLRNTTNPTDIVTLLRMTRADMLGTPDEAHYWDCHDAAAEIIRLRGVIDTYAHVCQASEREIRFLKERLAAGRIVHVPHEVED